MASLVAPLVSGIRGAESGTAEFFRAGTAQLATVYSDAEGVTSVSSHALNSNGALVRYVEERVDVVVKDTNAATVTTFTWGTDARDARLENLGFTGPDATGAIVAGGRTTVDAALSSLFASLGATNGNVLVNGSVTTLTLALSQSAGLVYNVKSGYGAVGDGVHNDSPNIQAAINAADSAGGGIIYFPHGTYLCNSAITCANSTAKFLFLGEAASGTSIKQGTSGITLLALGNSNQHLLLGLTFTATAANTGTLVSVGSTARATFVGCTFDPLNGTQVAMAADFTSKANYIGCTFSQAGASSKIATGSPSQSRFVGCDITTNGSNLTSFGTGMHIHFSSCTIEFGSAGGAAGTATFAPSTCFASINGGLVLNTFASGTVTVFLDCTAANIVGAIVQSNGAGTLTLSGGTSPMSEAGCVLRNVGSLPSIGTIGAGGRSYTRDRLRNTVSVSATSYAPDGGIGIHEVTSSGATMAFDNPSPDIPRGGPLVILYKNTSGAPITPTFGTAYSFITAVAAVNNNNSGIYYFVPRFEGGGSGITADLVCISPQPAGGTAL